MESVRNHLPSRLNAFLILLSFVGLLLWQGWLTWTLYGTDNAWERLTNDEPIVSGSHPLHLYHGYLGAQAFMRSGSTCCFDPAFQIGYPKTPVFDSGSRPAELFLYIAGGEYKPAAYKIGLAVCCWLVPVLVMLTARGFGLNGWGIIVAGALGQLIWWGTACQTAFCAGETDVLFAGLLLANHASFLIWHDRSPHVHTWLGLLVSAALGWFAHPVLFALAAPLLLIWYISAGVRHRSSLWHFSLLFCQVGALAVNAFWLADWVLHWQFRTPFASATELLPHRTLRTIWEAPLWGGTTDRMIVTAVVVSGLLGLAMLHWRKQRAHVRILGLGAGGLLLLAILGMCIDDLGRLGTSQLFTPALWFAVVASAFAWVQLVKLFGRIAAPFWIKGLTAAAAVALVIYLCQGQSLEGVSSYQRAKPLDIGIGSERLALIDCIQKNTDNRARILWEDRMGEVNKSEWTALLPMLTGRSFIGGLDFAGRIEHSHSGLVRRHLLGKPLAKWSDHELEKYCRRYNVGWVVAWSDVSKQRLKIWKNGTRAVSKISDNGDGLLFQIKRKSPSYVLQGNSRFLEIGSRRITLADVEPTEDGHVVLSFHYQSRLRVFPQRVTVEPDIDIDDPIPLLRLRLRQPVSRLTLTWDGS